MNSTPRTWHKITIQAPSALADHIAALLATLGDGGVEQGYTGFDENPELEEVTAYLADDSGLAEKLITIDHFLDELRHRNPSTPIPPPHRETIADCDWNAAWKKEFAPFAVVPGLIIKPSWEDYRPGPDEQVIEMDPGLAFGTGHHASTRLALQFLKEICHTTPPPATVMDVGCGTGILAMAAALWGAQRVLALDNDPQAVITTEENIRRNRLTDKISAETTPLDQVEQSFQVVLANIILEALLDLAPELSSHTASGGHLILAGILAGEQERQIERRFTSLGLTLSRRAQNDEWAAQLFYQA